MTSRGCVAGPGHKKVCNFGIKLQVDEHVSSKLSSGLNPPKGTLFLGCEPWSTSLVQWSQWRRGIMSTEKAAGDTLPDESSCSLKQQYEQLQEKNHELQSRLNDALSEVAVAVCVKESLVEMERRREVRDGEVASLQQLLQEAHQEADSTRTQFEHELARYRAIVEHLESENKDLKMQMKFLSDGKSDGNLLGTTGMDKDTLLGGAVALTDVTKSFARRMKSNFQTVIPTGGQNQPMSTISPSASSSAVLMADQDCMKKAYDDTELLKSIVVPLEEQIMALKDKLRQTDALLREHEANQSQMLLSVDSLGRWLSDKTKEEVKAVLQVPTGPDQANATELYPALLVTRLALLNDELQLHVKSHDSLVEQLDTLRKRKCELEKQAQIANSELVRCKQKHLSEWSRVSSLLTQDQKLKLSCQMNKEESEVEDQLQVGSLGGDLLISSTAWTEMQNELARLRTLLGVGLDDGIVSSQHFRQLQTQLQESTAACEAHAKQVEKLKAELQSESNYRRQVEATWNELAEQHKSESDSLSSKVRDLERHLDQLRLSYSALYDNTRKDLQSLTSDREKIVRELRRLQTENDDLLDKHSQKSEDILNEVINLPENLDDIHLLLLTYREKLIRALLAKEHFEEQLKIKVSSLEAQLATEQCAKESLRQELLHDIDVLKERIAQLESSKRDLEVEHKRCRDFIDSELRQKQNHANLLQQMDTLNSEKKRLEATIGELKARISNLKQELDNSMAVQTDFVRLSQSLQMQLEKIRSQETEVRWQHEDDTDECGTCRHTFNVTRRKHHCRHCGKIFCSDCVSKTVPSGPFGRLARVCDVCHTLLVQHSAPYFSTDAPHALD